MPLGSGLRNGRVNMALTQVRTLRRPWVRCGVSLAWWEGDLTCPSTKNFTHSSHPSAKESIRGLPGGPMVNSPSANAWDTSSIPSKGRCGLPWSN